MEKQSIIIIQRFYRNYIKWDREKVGTKYWPKDLILSDSFDPKYMIKLFFKGKSQIPGARHKVMIFNIQSLWKWIESSKSIKNPLNGVKFSKMEFHKISNFAISLKVTTNAKVKPLKKIYFPNLNSNQKKMEKLLVKLINLALTNQHDQIEVLLLDHGSDIDNDKLLINKLIRKNKLSNSIQINIPDINLIMAIALSGNSKTFFLGCEYGCDAKVIEPVTEMNAFHLAAMVGNISVLKKIQQLGGDVSTSSLQGSVIDILNKKGILALLFE